MLAVRDGDLDRLAPLFEQHQKHLYNFFLRMTGEKAASEDMVQEVFLRLLKYRQSYHDESCFLTWMFQIARNIRIDQYKTSRREKRLPEDMVVVSADPNPEEDMTQLSENELLQRALAMLPEDKREVLLLSRYQNLRFQDIARVLKSKEGTVKVRSHRAIKELGEIYHQLLKGENDTL